MKQAAIPSDETARQRAVDEVLLLRGLSFDDSLQRVVDLLHAACRPQACALTLIDGDRQVVLNKIGTSLSEVSRAISFCGHAILSDDVMVVEDARNDPRFHDNPMVTAAVNPVLHYAGVPIHGRDGQRVGVLCMMDDTPGVLPAESRETLVEFGRLADELLALHGQALRDPLTGAYQHKVLKALLGREWLRAESARQPVALLAFDIDCFKDFNDRYGFPEGDLCLKACADVLAGALRQSGDAVIRVSGEEFLVVLAQAGEAEALRVAECVRLALHQARIAHHDRPHARVTASIGVLALEPAAERALPVQALMRAGEAMQHAKESGRDCIASIGMAGTPQVHICAEYGPD